MKLFGSCFRERLGKRAHSRQTFVYLLSPSMISSNTTAVQMMSFEEKAALIHRLGDELGLKFLISPAHGPGDNVAIISIARPPTHLSIDPRTRVVDIEGNSIRLSRMEFSLLISLAKRAGDVVTVEEVWKDVFSRRGEKSAAYIRMYIRLLRLRIEPNPKFPTIISTVRQRGYKLNIPTYLQPT